MWDIYLENNKIDLSEIIRDLTFSQSNACWNKDIRIEKKAQELVHSLSSVQLLFSLTLEKIILVNDLGINDTFVIGNFGPRCAWKEITEYLKHV